MFSQVAPADWHLLVPEAGACFRFEEGRCHILLAIGLGLDRGTGRVSGRHGLVLREETLALLWSCLLTRTSCEPAPGSRLYRLPCHWAPAVVEPAGAHEERDTGAGLAALLRSFDRLHLPVPEGVSAFALGDNADDAVWYVGLVGRDEVTGERQAYLLREDWLENLWQALLLGPGSHFAEEGSPYQELLGATGYPKSVGETGD
jgi:hypothetical protein